ncbi:hypothetical protein SAMN05421676_11912 [Salinibacillus kushneri]|uniref:Uncharacterized protein n=1 Tax=Salinibacillus kushneri TaxID=237682 RepID=A0A1I0JF38_9BACI|nr:hypothetical protein [Salinibacillus kushneri]SEU08693.1 hypothetical protein SAMN05421676_11912 [Salinibacillus kushneri]
MGKFYRYKLPPWLRQVIFTIEKCTLPLMIYQIVRTLIIPTTLDVLLTGIFVGLFFAFYLEWF